METRTFGGFTDLNNFSNQYDIQNQYANVAKTSSGQHWTQMAANTLSGVGAGTSIGAAFGGIGAPVGAVLGGLVGLGKGAADWVSSDKKEADLTKQAEKFNAAVDENKFAMLKARTQSNDIRAMGVQAQLAKDNLDSYFTDIENPY